MRGKIITMRKPKMILFDYGQTIIAEEKFDGIKGTAAVMKHAVENRYHLTPEQILGNCTEETG